MYKPYRLFNLGFLIAAVFGLCSQFSLAQTGCTAPAACNYDLTATIDDGTCLYIGFPCDDGNPQTVDFISPDCICTGALAGCTTLEACNYNPMAMEPDFSCFFIGDPCDDGLLETNGDIITGDCMCVGEVMLITGCTALDACNYNSSATIDDSSCLFAGEPCDDGLTETSNDAIGMDCTCAGEIVMIEGCMVMDACNYDVMATVDDGSCLFIGEPCDDGLTETVNDMIAADCMCVGDVVMIEGCTATDACNYEITATVDNGSCLFTGDTCDDGVAETTNDVIAADCMCVGDVVMIEGCTATDACNYEITATVDNGSCLFTGDNCDDGLTETVNDIFGMDCVCAGENTTDIYGCTAMEACNYNPAATIDDASCSLPGFPCDDNNPNTEGDLYNLDCNCSGTLLGCTEIGACNYDSAVQFDNGSCYFPGDPCDDGVAESIDDLYDMDCVCAGIIPEVMGCTAPEACNFNPLATLEDSSCEFPSYPCNDNNDLTTDDVLGVDCVCAGILNGCIAPEACNFNPEALIDNATCVFPGEGCDDSDVTTDNDVYGNDCVCVGQDNGFIAGCMDITSCNYDSNATVDDGSCHIIGSSCEDGDPFTFNDVYLADCTCVGETQVFVEGCTAMEACNYNAAATIDDGSCALPLYPCDDSNDQTVNDAYAADCVCVGELLGCTNIDACNFNGAAIIDDSSCLLPGDSCDDDYIYSINDVLNSDCVCVGDTITGVAGCTAIEACNYNAEATIEDGSCELPGFPCDDNDSNTINDLLGADCVCTGIAVGCTLPSACNYNAEAVIEDNSCVFPGDLCDDNNLATDFDTIGADCVCAGVDNGLIPGCMNIAACNYDLTATIEDASCIVTGDACDDGDMFTFNDVIGADCICAGEIMVNLEGCTAIEACNYDAAATIDDGSCQLPGYPCDDNDPNTMGDALGLDCTCSGMIVGCTDVAACNYNALAAFEDGSCALPGSACDDGNAASTNDVFGADCICTGEIMQVMGCTNADACNYDAAANSDDGSCYFVGDACDDGNANTNNDVYNANCQCQGVVSVEEITAFYSVYPNPTNGAITVTQHQGASIQFIEVMDMTGKRVVTFNPNTSVYTIDLSTFAPGLYTLNIRSNNEMKSVRVQKN